MRRFAPLLLAAALAVFLLAFLVPLLAHAQLGPLGDLGVVDLSAHAVAQPVQLPALPAAVAPAPAAPSPVWGAIAAQLTVALAPVLLGLLGWLFALVRQLILAHVKNATISGILTRLDSYVEAQVRAVAQTYVDALKTSGAWNAATAAQANAQALAQLKANLGAQGIADLAGIVGVSNVEAFLTSKIEAQVHALKPAGA